MTFIEAFAYPFLVAGCTFAAAVIAGIYYGNRDAFTHHDTEPYGDASMLGRDRL